MPAHETQLIAAEPLSARTAAFHFAKPPGFGFKPGQTVDLTLPGAGKHTFSLVSAPGEDRLTIATRLRGSPFKRALAALAPGAAATVEGPYGSLTLPADTWRPAVLVAGGIGITPFVSMLRQADRDSSPRAMALVYSNRRPENAAFIEELRVLERRRKEFRLLATITGPGANDAQWAGRTGRIGPDLLREAWNGAANAVWYVTGSPAFVQGLRETLAGLDVGDDDVRSEEFFGY